MNRRRGGGKTGAGKGRSEGKGRGYGRGQGSDSLRPAPAAKKTAKLDTVFGLESFESIHALKADASRPLTRVAGSFEAGEYRHLLAYPCPREGSDRPVIGIPLRPTWTKEMELETLNSKETESFNEWLSDIYKKFPIEELNYFEHNLEVWRQVWRSAFERADIVVIVLDARIPLFHLSEAVFTHLREKLEKDVVLVLNKADLVPPASSKLWHEYLSQRCPGVKIVHFCVPKSGSGRVEQLPCGTELLDALKSCSVLRGGKRVPAGPFFEGDREDNPDAACERSQEEYITVVLQGDPNMGKSSIINAIFGRKLVSSSITPGHTKHFQTLFLSRGVCFCDSPGIVCPKLGVPKPLQTLFGSYRIAQVREPYHIIRFLAERCLPPLPELLKIAAFRDKDASKTEPWSPLSICEAFARKKGFLRKGGRVDPHRAANRLLTSALNGFDGLALCFAPPGTTAEAVRTAAAAAPPRPTWMVSQDVGDDDHNQHGTGSESGREEADEVEDDEDEEDEDGEVGQSKAQVPKVRNAFAALDSSESDSEASEQ